MEQPSRLQFLLNNLTKPQKIAIFVVLQIFVIVIFIFLAISIFRPNQHIDIQNKEELGNIPSEELSSFDAVLWNLLTKHYDNLDKSILKDVVVRENTYSENTDQDSKITTADFLIDIESLKLTYDVSIQWTKSESLPDGIIIDCPPISDMKYPETFCQGMYQNTNSFSLYFPYYKYKDDEFINDDDEDIGYDSGLLYLIEGDEETKTITIESSICDPDKYNAEALGYIKDRTPFYNNNYTINYTVNEIDVTCE